MSKQIKSKPKRVWLPEYKHDGVLRRRRVSENVALDALGSLNEMLRLRDQLWTVQRNFEQKLNAEYSGMTFCLMEFDPTVNITDLDGLADFMYGITRED